VFFAFCKFSFSYINDVIFGMRLSNKKTTAFSTTSWFKLASTAKGLYHKMEQILIGM